MGTDKLFQNQVLKTKNMKIDVELISHCDGQNNSNTLTLKDDLCMNIIFEYMYIIWHYRKILYHSLCINIRWRLCFDRILKKTRFFLWICAWRFEVSSLIYICTLTWLQSGKVATYTNRACLNIPLKPSSETR